MIANLKWLMPLVAVGLPLAASAQVSDATYCGGSPLATRHSSKT